MPQSASREDMETEHERLEAARKGVAWRKWGPYLSERQWGTVREDYSDNGDAWNYFTHDQARSRAYRWGEDGLAGISDDQQRLCFALALWNGNDPDPEGAPLRPHRTGGNHGEDVKEYYFYLDSTPTHSYMKYLYKYPQAAFPYDDLVETNGRRTTRRVWSTNCSTPASSTAIATSTCSSSTPRPARRMSSCGSRSYNRGPDRPNCTCCRRCGSATTGRPGCDGRPRSPSSDKVDGRGHERGRGDPSAIWGRTTSPAKATAAAVH